MKDEDFSMKTDGFVGLLPNREREKKLYRMLPFIGLIYRSFGKYRRENMEYCRLSEEEIIAWIKGENT
jgi:hypothetical protein